MLPFSTARWLVGLRLVVGYGLWLAGVTLGGGHLRGEDVEVLRDPWGVPHIFAATDAGAFYGLGYATAEDRAFQMTYSLRIVQGRLSEVVGDVRQLQRNSTSVEHDRKMRTFGFARAAQRTAANLDPEMRSLLEAYCDGVNRWFSEHAGGLPDLFATTGLTPELWTPADCLASWWHMAQFFATDGTRDLLAGRNAAAGTGDGSGGEGRRGAASGREGARRAAVGRSAAELEAAGLTRLPPDEMPAVVKRGDLSAEWMGEVQRFAREHGLTPGEGGQGAGEGPKFSHAWVVGGKKTTTGSAVLVSDPQTPVRNPSMFYEFHIQGRTFNARGIGVPGSPVLLIGFTDRVAWGVTALGADQADLFQLETDSARPNQYRFDDEWRPMTEHRETIQVKGAAPVSLVVRETHLGPVATEFCFAQPGDPEVALKRIPMCETNCETVEGAVRMLRARDTAEFDAALAGWRFPSANLVFGDRAGSVGYRAVGAIPVRSRLDASHGASARPGHRAEQDWQGIIPSDLMPGVRDPAAGFVYSGNHRSIEAWYPLPLGAMTGGGGDTVRSWRLRERLTAQERFTAEDVRAIHGDAVNPARRDIVRLGLHLRDGLKRELSADARAALQVLAPWYQAGARSALTESGAALALELNTFFRFVSTDLAFVYGGGESGLAYFLKTVTARIEREAAAAMSSLEEAFIDQSLAVAWSAARRKYGDDPAGWREAARAAVARQQLGYYESLDGFPALDRKWAVAVPSLEVTDPGTIACQTAQAYTQWVPMHDPDQAQSLLPLGQAERFDDPSRARTLELWGHGRLHPAPLSRAAVEALGVTPTRLAWNPNAKTSATAAPSTTGVGRKPDVVILLSDDMGFSDVGCYGGEIETPNLDGLAANGLRFTQFYNTARCCPTRASLLTGLHPHQAGIGHMMEDRGLEGYRGRLNRQCVTLAEALRPAGYRTYAVGKWHVTPGSTAQALEDTSLWPLQRGFDRYYGTIHGAGSYWDPSALVRDNRLITVANDPEYRPAEYYYTDAIADHAVRFIREHARARPDGPLLLYVAFTAAHWPMHAKAQDMAKYRGRYAAGYQAIRDARWARLKELGLVDPAWRPAPTVGDWSGVKNRAFEERCMEVYAAMVDCMDQGIGRIVAELRAHGRLDNTLLLYLQDNGGCAENVGRGTQFTARAERPSLPQLDPSQPQYGSQPKQTRDGRPVRQGYGVMPGEADTYVAYGRDWANVSNTPFREYKHWVHEGGISTPLIVHWPAGIAASRRGQLTHEPGQLMDIMATGLDVAGAGYPTEVEGQRITPLQGVSLRPVFEGRPLTRPSPLLWEHEGNRAIRVGAWKLVSKGPKGAWELYNLAADRTELNDLASAEPERVHALSARWEEWARASKVLPWPWEEMAAEGARARSARLKGADAASPAVEVRR